MRWQGREGSRNVEDRRGGRSGGGGFRRPGRKAAGFGIGTVIIFIIALLFGQDPSKLLEAVQSPNSGGAVTTQQQAPASSQPSDELGQFVSVVLKDTEDVFAKLFREQLNRQYEPPVLVLFSGQTQSGCGFASAATGPFYCPADRKIYIDLAFCQELRDRFKAPGDFAVAYVIAHEVGHHIQNLLGISGQVSRQRRVLPKKEYNKLSVRLELQADFLSGVWAHHAHKMKNILEEGDLEEAMRAASAIGDDRLQKQAQGYVVPDSFTHGTSEQRMRWFRKGVQTGDLSQGDTFASESI